MEYIHTKPQSLKVSLLKLFAKIIRLNNGLKKKLDTGDFSTGWVPEPPKFIHEKFKLRTEIISGHNVYTISPKQNNSDKYILYLHGGAYVNKFVKQHWGFTGAIIKNTGATIIMPDYPLAPKYTFTDTIKMVEKVYSKLRSNIDSKEIIFMGDSAGAGLALALAQKLKTENIEQASKIILLSPWLDVSMTNPDTKAIEQKDIMLKIDSLKRAGKLYADNSDIDNYLISPLNGSVKGLEEISIFIGTHDLLYPDCIKLKTKLKEVNTVFNFFEYPKMFHDWMLLTGLEESKSALQQIVAIIKK
jgi:acetyl esterase/lipase